MPIVIHEAISPDARVTHVMVSNANKGGRSRQKFAVVAVMAGAAMLVALVALTAFRPTGIPQQLAQSSCIGDSCGNNGEPANIFFGATHIDNKYVKAPFLYEDQPGGPHPMDGSDQGMWNGYAAIRACWHDTTYMDNLRGAAAGVAGGKEPVLNPYDPKYVPGGHTIHMDSNTGPCPGDSGGSDEDKEEDNDDEEDSYSYDDDYGYGSGSGDGCGSPWAMAHGLC